MEEDKDQKHICRFCSKSFPCGRSLGGHMRSHLITVSSTDHKKADENTPDKKKKTKKLPPLVNGGIIPIPKKPNKPLTSSEEDTLLHEKLCKECGKTFQSWKALFGHMKCHSVNGKTFASSSANTPMEEYSSNSQSEEASAKPMLPCKRKRSYRTKRYTTTSNTNSSSLTNTNLSSSISEIDEQEEQEEVALSLIILSRDRGDWRSGNSNSDRSSDFREPKRVAKELEIKSLPISRNGLESEVNSPKNLIEGGGIFFDDRERRNKINKARRSLNNNNNNVASDFENKSKCFTCSICKKAFSSYQALGGHRASHKKFKGCCAPITGNMFEPENSHSQGGNNNNNNDNNNNNKIVVSGKSSKEHECPICFKVFSSGQALGGHKRSHLIVNRNPVIEKTRNFLDLNLPAPDEEEEEEQQCNEFKPWWIEPSREQEPLLGLLSS
ncbi:hypothetical protein ACP275_04G151200 [Erythranthe tilingii]